MGKQFKSCEIIGCTDNHPKHYCRNCGDQNSNHFSKYCTKTHLICKVKFCKEKHTKHYCKVCEDYDSNHLASECTKGITLYHGTKLQYALLIQKNGFKPSVNGRLGGGVYFAQKWQDAQKIAKHRDPLTPAIIQCKLMGDHNEVKKSIHPPWYGVTTNTFDEYCIVPSFIKRIKIIKFHLLH